MAMTHVGDLSRSFVFQAESARLKTQLTQLTTELASGETSNQTSHLNGNLNLLSSIEHALSITEQYQSIAQEAKSFADGQQTALSSVQTRFESFAESMLTAAQSELPVAFSTLSLQAEDAFRDTVSQLNTSVAGRALFSGNALDSAALADPDTILSALRAAIPAAATPTDLETAVHDWFFNVGGGFETLAYTGSDFDLEPLRVAEGQTAQLNQRADDDSIRHVLKDLAVMTLATDAAYGFSSEFLKTTAVATSENAFQSLSELTEYRASLGLTQARIELAATENSANQTAQTLARNALVSVDPFEISTELQDVQFQMEALYSVTARLSRLKLTEYL